MRGGHSSGTYDRLGQSVHDAEASSPVGTAADRLHDGKRRALRSRGHSAPARPECRKGKCGGDHVSDVLCRQGKDIDRPSLRPRIVRLRLRRVKERLSGTLVVVFSRQSGACGPAFLPARSAAYAQGEPPVKVRPAASWRWDGAATGRTRASPTVPVRHGGNPGKLGQIAGFAQSSRSNRCLRPGADG